MSWKTIDNPLLIGRANDPLAKFHFNIAYSDPPDELYHYINLESFIKLLDSQVVYATEHTYLNDPNEYAWGLNYLKQLLTSKSGKTFPRQFVNQLGRAIATLDARLLLFVFSLSANPDLLSQWRAYSGDCTGFSVGFDGGTMRKRAGFGEFTLDGINLDTLPEEHSYCYHLLRVVYDKSEQEEFLLAFLEAALEEWRIWKGDGEDGYEIFRTIVNYRLKELLISFKSPGYSEECEWRIVAASSPASSRILFRNGKYGITPFLPLNISKKTDLPAARLPISSIWTGPCSPVKTNPKGLRMLLDRKKIDAPIYCSQVDIR